MSVFGVRRSWAILVLGAAFLVAGTSAAADDASPPPPPPPPQAGFVDGSSRTITAPGAATTINLNVSLTSTDSAATGTTDVTWTVTDTSQSGNSGGGTLTFNLDGSDSPHTVPIKVAGLAGGTITVSLKNGDDKSTLRDGAGTATITVDPAPVAAVADKTVAGQPGPTAATLPVTLSKPAAKDVVVAFDVADKTAVSGTDYSIDPRTVTVPAGSTSAPIPITIKGATKGGTFTVTLKSVTSGNATLGNATATVTITPAPIPKVAVQDTTVQRTSQDYLAQIPITVNPASGVSPITVDYVVTEGTASYGSDFENVDTRLTIPVGQTSSSIPIRIRAGTTGGTFTLTLKGASSNAQIQRSTATVTITPPASALPKVSIAPLTIASAGTADRQTQIPVTLSTSTGTPVTVTYNVANGSALNGTDFALTGGTLTFNAGQTIANIPVTIKAGTKGGTFSISLSNPSNNATLGTSSATITISAAAAVVPRLSLSDATFAAGATDASVVLTATLSSASQAPVTVSYAATDGTAKNGTDYVLTAGTLTFPANTLTQTIPLTIKAGSAGGTFTVSLSAPNGATIDGASGTASVSIVNGPALSISDIEVAENVAGGNVTLTVTLVGNPTTAVSVNYATKNGTALAPTDYVATQGRLDFATGQTSKTIAIPIVDNQQISDDKTFTVTLANPVGAAIARAQATVTIVDDESGAATAGSAGVDFGRPVVVGGQPKGTPRGGSGGSTSGGGQNGSNAGSNTGGTGSNPSNSKTGSNSQNANNAPTGGKAGNAGSAAAQVKVAAVSTRVGANRLLRLRVSCPKTAAARCTGSVVVAAAKTAQRKAQTLGHASISLKPGGAGVVTLKLAPVVTSLLAHAKTLKTTMTITIGNGSSLAIATHTLTLQRTLPLPPTQPSIVVTSP